MAVIVIVAVGSAMIMWMFVPVGTAGAVGGMHMFVRMINGCRRGSGCLLRGVPDVLGVPGVLEERELREVAKVVPCRPWPACSILQGE